MNEPTSLKLRLANFGTLDRQLTKKEQWVTFWALFFFCTATMYNSIRVTPVLTGIGAEFGMGLADAAYIVSAFALAGLVFAYPGAWIMRTFGVKSSLLIAAVISIIGTVMGLFVASPEAFLASRALEGCAFGIASVIVPNVIPRIFPVSKMGLVMGIWSLWVTPGLILGFITSPLLFTSFGYRSLWLLALALEILSTLWILVSVKLPAIPENMLVNGDVTKKRVYRHVHFKSAMAIAISMLCWGVVYGAVNTFYPTYLQEVKGMSLFASSMVPLLLAVITAPFGILFGVLAGKTRSRKWFLVIPYALVTALYLSIGFNETSEVASAWVFALLFGVCAGGIPMATYALIPLLAGEPKKADYCTATLAFCLQLGSILMGSLGSAIASLGYRDTALFILAPVAAIGLVIALLSTGDRQALREQEDELADAAPSRDEDAATAS